MWKFCRGLLLLIQTITSALNSCRRLSFIALWNHIESNNWELWVNIISCQSPKNNPTQYDNCHFLKLQFSPWIFYYNPYWQFTGLYPLFWKEKNLYIFLYLFLAIGAVVLNVHTQQQKYISPRLSHMKT